MLDRLRLPTNHGGLVARLSLLHNPGQVGLLALRSSLHLGSEVVPTPGESGHLRRLASGLAHARTSNGCTIHVSESLRVEGILAM